MNPMKELVLKDTPIEIINPETIISNANNFSIKKLNLHRK